MNVTWEMIVGFASVLATLGAMSAWLVRRFDRLSGQIGKIDKKKVSHKTCIERRKECPCVIEFNKKIGGKK